MLFGGLNWEWEVFNKFAFSIHRLFSLGLFQGKNSVDSKCVSLMVLAPRDSSTKKTGNNRNAIDRRNSFFVIRGFSLETRSYEMVISVTTL